VINQAIFYYGEAKRLTGDKILQANYTLAQAQLAINSQQFQIAISALNEVISLTPTSSEIWKYEQTLAQLYAQINDKSNALNQATMALNAAPQDQKKTIESLITQLQAMP
jgi:Flp pilus assembly protein TadD